jgi:hypothetical protein
MSARWWVCLAVCGVVAILWVTSGRYHMHLMVRAPGVSRVAELEALRGQAQLALWTVKPTPQSWRCRFRGRVIGWQFRWWFRIDLMGAGGHPIILTVPMWLVIVPLAWLTWKLIGTPLHHCRYCGYDLRGRSSGACPECGRQA